MTWNLPEEWAPSKGARDRARDIACETRYTEPEGHGGEHETRLQILDHAHQVKQRKVGKNLVLGIPPIALFTHNLGQTNPEMAPHTIPTTFFLAALYKGAYEINPFPASFKTTVGRVTVSGHLHGCVSLERVSLSYIPLGACVHAHTHTHRANNPNQHRTKMTTFGVGRAFLPMVS